MSESPNVLAARARSLGGWVVAGVVLVAIPAVVGNRPWRRAPVAAPHSGRAVFPPLLARPREVPPVDTFRNAVDPAKLAAILERLRPLSPKPKFVSILVATHALRLWGATTRFPEGPTLPLGYDFVMHQYSCPTLLRLLLDGDAFARMYPNSAPFLQWTSFGLLPLHKVDRFQERPVTTWPDCEAHVDKLTSVLGEIGVARDVPVRAEGRDGTVADLLRDSLARFDWGQELDFSAKAYLSFVGAPARWRNRFGEPIALEEIVARVAGRPLGEGACVGTHACQVMALALRVDSDGALLSARGRRRVTDRLREVCRLLERSQHADGSWPPNWFGGAGKVPLAEVDGDFPTRLRTVGHHLEWIAIAPPEIRPSDRCVTRAIAYLQETMATLSGDFYYNFYPPLTHGGRALVLLSGRSPEQLIAAGSSASLAD